MEILKNLQIILLLASLSFLSLTWTGEAYAQPAPKPASGAKSPATPRTGNQEELPLNITADRLEVDQNQQVATFINKVVTRYKDIILYADVLKIFYQSKKQPAGPKSCPATSSAQPKTASAGNQSSPMDAVGIEKITRIEAEGKVRMVQGDRIATGDKAIYYTQEDKIVLLGHPQLWRGENSLTGHEIIFYAKENRAVVEGEINKRVQAVIYPSQKVQLPGQQSAPAGKLESPSGKKRSYPGP
jgi:lipopolysaccharide export system protein LptA